MINFNNHKILMLLLTIFLGTVIFCDEHNIKGTTFMPLKEGDVKCTIKFKPEHEYPEFLELTITNVKKTPIAFTNPKKVYKESSYANSIRVKLQWGKDSSSELYYFNFTDELNYDNVELEPNNSISIDCKMSDMYIQRRCNLLKFNKCFEKGDDEVKAQLLILNEDVKNGSKKIVSESNNEIFNASYSIGKPVK